MKKSINALAAICSLQFAFLPLGTGLLHAQNLSVNTTGALNSTNSMFEILQPNLSVGTTGLYVTHSGALSVTGTKYGLQGLTSGVSAAGSTHISGYFSALGATNNYGLWVNAGGVRFVPLASGVNGAILRTTSTGDLGITNFTGSATNILLGNNTFGTIATAGGVTGSGTINYLARWTTATNLGNGVVQDNASTVGINAAPSASYQLYVQSALTSILGASTGASTYGVLGTSTSATGFGVYGFNSNASGTGILGVGNNIGGSYLIGGSGGAFTSTNVGVAGFGNNTAASWGVYGTSANGTGTGVDGYNSVAGATVGFGVFGQTAATGGSAVAAYNGAGGASYFAGSAFSGIAISTIAGGVGVIGACDNATGRGLVGQTTGASGYGVYALNAGNPAGAGVFGGHSAGVAGTGFTNATARGAVKGEGAVPGAYGFGVIGSGGNTGRSGGVLGDDYNLRRGSLGYYSSGLIDYSGYFFGNASVTGVAGGRMFQGGQDSSEITGIGIGVSGGVMGAWIKGLVYGTHMKGELYSSYVDGKSYTNNVITQLETTENNRERIPTYVPTSLSVDITARGVSSLQNGRTFIPFNEKFREVVSKESPVMVTATPNGESNGIYISSVTAEGFYVVENNNGTSKVQFTWIAIGTKKGYENPKHSAELLSPDFDKTMNGVMFDDSDAENNGTPIWWDGKAIRFDTPPLIERPSMFAEMAPMKTRERKKMDVMTIAIPKDR